ncbi:MAG: hypothetical protein MJE68_33480, partial [Proteobacteria bacterium]|nr:hypothetical protein [Pseudomonadota bacterium]
MAILKLTINFLLVLLQNFPCESQIIMFIYTSAWLKNIAIATGDREYWFIRISCELTFLNVTTYIILYTPISPNESWWQN